MKKLALLLVFALVAVFVPNAAVAENEGFSIAGKIRDDMLSSHPDIAEKLTELNRQSILKDAYRNIDYDEHTGRHRTEEQVQKYIADFLEQYDVVPEKGFAFYPLITWMYSKQYAEHGKFESLILQDKIWVATRSGGTYGVCYYDKDFSRVPANFAGVGSSFCSNEMIAFLKEPEKIESMVKSEIQDKIVDCKITIIQGNMTILYLDGVANDYGIKLTNNVSNSKFATPQELFKIYPILELIGGMENLDKITTRDVLEEKPTYDTEAEALQAEGLLNGNENGLDLLKPLTRIEAAAILVRALGYENEPTEVGSQFIDIPDDSWAVKYANIAADKGITNGIGDGEFAPDALVTDNQFATFVLRAADTGEFDWMQAINILIEQGIITQEQADTMDLFTRGDMAKIIYEARAKGLLQQ